MTHARIPLSAIFPTYFESCCQPNLSDGIRSTGRFIVGAQGGSGGVCRIYFSMSLINGNAKLFCGFDGLSRIKLRASFG